MTDIDYDDVLLVSLKHIVQAPSERPSAYFLRVFKSVNSITISTHRTWDQQKVLLQVFFHGCHDYGILTNVCVTKWLNCAPDFLQFYNAILVEEGRRVAERLLKKKGIVWKNNVKRDVVQSKAQKAKNEDVCFENIGDDFDNVLVQDSNDDMPASREHGGISVNEVDCDTNYVHFDDDLFLSMTYEFRTLIYDFEYVYYIVQKIEWQVKALSILHLMALSSLCSGDIFYRYHSFLYFISIWCCIIT